MLSKYHGINFILIKFKKKKKLIYLMVNLFINNYYDKVH